MFVVNQFKNKLVCFVFFNDFQCMTRVYWFMTLIKSILFFLSLTIFCSSICHYNPLQNKKFLLDISWFDFPFINYPLYHPCLLFRLLLPPPLALINCFASCLNSALRVFLHNWVHLEKKCILCTFFLQAYSF